MMTCFQCQEQAKLSLQTYAELDKRSLVVEGPEGSGKRYLSRAYAKMLGIRDIVPVQPRVSDIKATLDGFNQVDNRVLIVVENLDLGVPACSYVLLKFMEEPKSNCYVIVTCSSKNNVPDTILSRSIAVSILPPTRNDILAYYKMKQEDTGKSVNETLLRSTKSFSDVDTLFTLTKQQQNYVLQWSSESMFKGSVSDICWKLGHCDDGVEIPCEIVIKYIMASNTTNRHVVLSCRKCLDVLNSRRIATHLTLSKLAFDIKYCE